jgi:hypothetical protein
VWYDLLSVNSLDSARCSSEREEVGGEDAEAAVAGVAIEGLLVDDVADDEEVLEAVGLDSVDDDDADDDDAAFVGGSVVVETAVAATGVAAAGSGVVKMLDWSISISQSLLPEAGSIGTISMRTLGSMARFDMRLKRSVTDLYRAFSRSVSGTAHGTLGRLRPKVE